LRFFHLLISGCSFGTEGGAQGGKFKGGTGGGPNHGAI